MLNMAYKAKISSWRNMLSYYVKLSSHPIEEDSEVVPTKVGSAADKGKILATSLLKKRKTFANRKQVVFVAPKASVDEFMETPKQ